MTSGGSRGETVWTIPEGASADGVMSPTPSAGCAPSGGGPAVTPPGVTELDIGGF
jgi:hypothetical protein